MTVGKSNYVAVNNHSGATCFANLDPESSGMFSHINYYVRQRHVTDGTSHTTLLGERCWEYQAGGQTYYPYAANQFINRDTRDETATHQPCGFFGLGSSDGCGSAVSGNSINFAYLDPREAMDGFSSLHPSGANFAFVDGSIHFISELVDAEVMVRLCNKSDGQTVGEFD